MQGEYLNRIQRMLRVRSLVEQVKESLIQQDSHDQRRKDFTKLFQQVWAVLSSDSIPKKDVVQAS